jgi:hypothetical protein
MCALKRVFGGGEAVPGTDRCQKIPSNCLAVLFERVHEKQNPNLSARVSETTLTCPVTKKLSPAAPSKSILLMRTSCPKSPKESPYHSGRLWTRRDSNPHLITGQRCVNRFYNDLQTRGDCQNTRKPYKSSYIVGWVVGGNSIPEGHPAHLP